MPISNHSSFFEAIQRWQQSGLSQKTWCEQNDMAYHVFHYWYRRFRNQHSKPTTDNENSFIQLTVADPASTTPWCEVVLAGGQKLVFHQPVAAAFIKSLLD
jgi:hypothetical protein